MVRFLLVSKPMISKGGYSFNIATRSSSLLPQKIGRRKSSFIAIGT